ncbi:hypothetical protein SDC9_168623 [bioreactor metagenome]|uniref:Branched-chain amino acid transport system carrier protein n=1 Tax=bioreactor metagenome TaxID=1076179 RepID=A0A645GB01_9ZZZZ
MTLFGSKIKNDNAFKFATYVALLVSVITVVDSMGIQMAFIHKLPFDSLGFNWIVPVIIAGVVGSLIPSKKALSSDSLNQDIINK